MPDAEDCSANVETENLVTGAPLIKGGSRPISIAGVMQTIPSGASTLFLAEVVAVQGNRITSPAGRLAGFGIVGIAVIAFVVFGLILPDNSPLALRIANTAGPSPTFTLTPTFSNATGQAPAARGTLVPLAELLEAPHTPTPLYVNTPPEPISGDIYRGVKTGYEREDWDAVIDGMLEIAKNEPEAAYPYYYIGEAYRFKGETSNALNAYNEALKIDPEFGPPYLGLARVRLLQEPNLDVGFLFEEALKRDPNFGEVYLERAVFYLNRQEPEQALADLKTAERLLPGSPLVYYYEARAHLVLGDTDDAETAAFKANQADPTMLLVYFTLGEVYLAQEKYADAIEVLQTYVSYETRNATARAMVGEAYYEAGDCKSAIEALGVAISMDSRQRKAYLYRGLCYLEAEEIDKAKADLERAQQYYQDDFELNLSLMRISMLQERFGDAYLQGESVLSLAETDGEEALAYYWRALNFEEREEPDNAAKSSAGIARPARKRDDSPDARRSAGASHRPAHCYAQLHTCADEDSQKYPRLHPGLQRRQKRQRQPEHRRRLSLPRRHPPGLRPHQIRVLADEWEIPKIRGAGVRPHPLFSVSFLRTA